MTRLRIATAKKSGVRFQLIVLLVSLLWSLPCSFAQTSDWQVETILTIGNDESLAEEYLLGGVRDVVTDSQGRIYVADYPRLDIRVYSKEGVFLKNIGSSGAGPGEFLEIRSLGMDEDDQLIVPDRMNQRITIYSDLGTSFETYQFVDPAHGDVSYLSRPSSGSILVFHIRRDRESGEFQPPIHLFDESFETELESFGSVQDIYDTSVNINKRIAWSSSSYLLSTDSYKEVTKVYVVPSYYEGKVIQYVFHAGRLAKTDRLESTANSGPAYRELLFDPNNTPQHLHYMSGPEGTFVLEPLSRTRGVFELNDGGVLVFATIREGDSKRLFVDVFRSGGKFDGRHLISNIPAHAATIPWPYEVKWKDESDRFYVAHYSDLGTPLLSVVRFRENLE